MCIMALTGALEVIEKPFDLPSLSGALRQVRATLDAAYVLPLGPAGAAPGWVVESLLVDGRRVAPADGPWRNEVTVPTTGRHTVEVDLLPRVEAAGDVEMLAVSLPPAPAAKLATDAVAWCVDHAPHWSPMSMESHCEKLREPSALLRISTRPR